MLKSYFLIAYRNLSNHKGYTLVNTVGMGMGICSVLLIALYVYHEFSYDRFHENHDRIFRVAVDRVYEDGRVRKLAPTSPPLARELEASIPEIEKAVRVFVPQHTIGHVSLAFKENSFFEKRFFYVDPEVFDVFNLPLVKGDPRSALKEVHSLVLTETMARKYFGPEDPIGQVLILDDSLSLEVTGVMRDLPSATHLKMDFLAPYALLEKQYGYRASGLWQWDLVHTYTLLQKGADAQRANDGIQGFLDQEVAPITEDRRFRYVAHLQPLTQIHLYSDREWELEAGGSPVYLYSLFAIGLFVLLIAVMNFVNLSTAMASRRAREVGLRKALGGLRSQLIVQFLCEAILLSLISLLIALLGVYLLLPVFEAIAMVNLTIESISVELFVGVLILIVLCTGLAAGGFSAFYLSSLRPTSMFKGSYTLQGGALRRILVVTQFALSILAICATTVVYSQLQYMRDKELGFDKEQVIVLKTGRLTVDQTAVLKEELLKGSGIEAITAASGMPGGMVEKMHVTPEGMGDGVSVQMLWVDHDFVRTLGVELVSGRDFSETHRSDASHAFLINETAARLFNMAEPLGKRINWAYFDGERDGTVVGVMKDFHAASFKEQIAPLVLLIHPVHRYLAVRVQTERIEGVLGFIQEEWAQLAPGRPLELTFLDREFETLYESEKRLAVLFAGFTLLAITIACIGLFGLAAFTVVQRKKEIGVRKILGASTTQILVLVSQEYVKLVVIAFMLAVPLAHIGAARWLQQFVYHTRIGTGLFIVTGIAVLALALCTVCYQTLRVAFADPVESLRYE